MAAFLPGCFETLPITVYHLDLFGTGAIEQQQYAVYSDLAKVLETDFTGGNKVLIQLSNFYNSCIAAQMMNETEFVDKLVPVIRKFYQELGKCNFIPHYYHYCLFYYAGGWSLVGIPGDGTVWSVNSSQFIREKLTKSDAFYSISVGCDEDARLYSLVVSITRPSVEIRP